MTKINFRDIEKEFCVLFDLKLKDSHVMNQYTIDTVNGEYKVWFDTSMPFAIFGKFSFPKKVTKFLKYTTVNEFSGKMNFHGENQINGFLSVIKEMKRIN